MLDLMLHQDILTTCISLGTLMYANVFFPFLTYLFWRSGWRAGNSFDGRVPRSALRLQILLPWRKSKLSWFVFISACNDSRLISLHIPSNICIRPKHPLIVENVWVLPLSIHHLHPKRHLFVYGHDPLILASSLHSLAVVSWVWFSDSADKVLDFDNVTFITRLIAYIAS